MADVLVVGCGLIGTSMGLALRASGWDPVLQDLDETTWAEAHRRGAGRPWDGKESCRIAVVAVPPGQTAAELLRLQKLGLAQTFTHVASVQSHVQREVEALGCDLSTIVGGHPLAGRETSGPGAATADLFVGRPWAVCPSPQSRPEALADVVELAEACGADPVHLPAQEHDRAVALLSHLPQIVASALAGALVAGDTGTAGPAGGTAPLALAGPGLIDTTRLAASDPRLWTQILELNAGQIAPLVHALSARLDDVARALDRVAQSDADEGTAAARELLSAFLARGNAGRAQVPVKRGELAEAFARVRLSVRDEPGRLAALLADAASAGANVEDVHVEHLPGRPTGVIELMVATADADALAGSLAGRGWTVL